MRAHDENAKVLAGFLRGHPKVKEVYYPGFGGMLSVRFFTGEDAIKFVSNLKLFAVAESLGGVESLVSIPALMTHASLPYEERIKRGIDETLVRLSVGIEEAEDILEDVKNALASL